MEEIRTNRRRQLVPSPVARPEGARGGAPHRLFDRLSDARFVTFEELSRGLVLSGRTSPPRKTSIAHLVNKKVKSMQDPVALAKTRSPSMASVDATTAYSRTGNPGIRAGTKDLGLSHNEGESARNKGLALPRNRIFRSFWMNVVTSILRRCMCLEKILRIRDSVFRESWKD